MKVLLVEDNIELNKTIQTFLEIKNFQVDSVTDGKKALNLIKKEIYDLYIMDIHLPKTKGTELIKHIRDKNANSPIIMMTSSTDIEPFLKSFENGCNEYIKKPFHFEELEIRMNNLLKNKQTSLIYLTKNIQFDTKTSEIIIDGKSIDLRKKERRLLHILVENKNRVVLKDELNRYIWKDEDKKNYPLRQLISGLKQRIPELKNNIQSVSRLGYKLVFE